MTQKALNKMNKYCKLTGLRMGQLIANLTYAWNKQNDPYYISDKELEKEFNKYLIEHKPPKRSGGYYPKGHPIKPKTAV